jgi:hypothetical protein
LFGSVWLGYSVPIGDFLGLLVSVAPFSVG